jgi:mannose-6-phosphate isomerase-like protein (cupin superfamily)
VKIVYGRSKWLLGNQELFVDKDDVLVIPKGMPHAVLDNPEPRLTLTLNVTG